MKHWIGACMVACLVAAEAQDVPLQRPEERQVTRRQSAEIYDVLRPVARPVSRSAVWVWAGGRQLAVGTDASRSSSRGDWGTM